MDVLLGLHYARMKWARTLTVNIRASCVQCGMANYGRSGQALGNGVWGGVHMYMQSVLYSLRMLI